MSTDKVETAVADQNGDKPLGILLVHGIGVQEQGATLSHAGGRLIEWLSRWLNLEAQPRICSSTLKPAEADSDVPAHALVEVRPPGTTQRVLLAESWWAKQFDPPPFGELCIWLLGNGAIIALRQVSLYVSGPARYLFALALESLPKSLPREGLARAESGVHLIGMILGATLGVFAVVLLQLFVVLLYIMSLIPIDAIKDSALRIAVALTQYLGDSYLFVSNPLIRAAIEEKLRRDLKWLEVQCDPVVVLAHSQGAAVVYDALRDQASPKIRLITYGAGIRKLFGDQREITQPSLTVRLMRYFWLFSLMAMVCPFLIRQGVVFFQELPPADRMNVTHPNSHFAGIFLFVYYILTIVLVIATQTREASIEDELKDEVGGFLKADNSDIEWLDVFASADPVPGGPLFDQWNRGAWQRSEGIWRHPELGRYRAVPVTNQFSLVADHNSYWESFDGFTLRVIEQIDAWTKYGWMQHRKPQFQATPSRHAASRATRVLLRVVLHLVVMISSMFLMVTLWEEWTRSLAPLWSIPPLNNFTSTWPMGDSLRSGLKGLSVLLLGIAVHGGAALVYVKFFSGAVWRGWDNEFTRYRRQVTVATCLRGGLYFLVFVGLAALPVLAAREAMISGSYGSMLALPRDMIVDMFRWVNLGWNRLGVAIVGVASMMAAAALIHFLLSAPWPHAIARANENPGAGQ